MNGFPYMPATRSCASGPPRRSRRCALRWIAAQGLPRVGIIQSLGQLRDDQSAVPLAKLLGDSDVQVTRAAALALGELGTTSCAETLMKAPADTIGREVIGQALVICADRLLAANDMAGARQSVRIAVPADVREWAPHRSAARTSSLRQQRGYRHGDGRRGLVTCSGSACSCCASRSVRSKPMRRSRPGLMKRSRRRPTSARRQAIVSQLAGVPNVSALKLAVEVMKRDEAVREAAADVAARLGRDLAGSQRELVKPAMQQVIALSHNADTIKLADVALRDAARSVNLALNATVSSPDDLEPDGGSGPDAAAVDGNRATYWDETDNQPVYRFQVSFNKPTKVNTLVIVGHAYQSHSPKDFEVLCDDQVVASVTDAPYDERTNETHVNFTRVRVHVLGTEDYGLLRPLARAPRTGGL